MERILLIETSAALCSVALAEDGACVAYKECTTPRSHAAMTTVLIDELLREGGLRIQDCTAVCVSKGPGSYTGLRVGVSTAKGLCFGAGRPLLSVGTLDILVQQAVESENAGSEANGQPAASSAASGASSETAVRWDAIIPVIDARRDEVYTAVYRPAVASPSASASIASPTGKPYSPLAPDSPAYEAVSPVRSLIVGQDDFGYDFSGKSILFIGDAADKCQRLLSDSGTSHPTPGSSPADATLPLATSPLNLSRCRFLQTQPKASAMAVPAFRALAAGTFEDVAYFEPFYLKDFVATTPKKLF